MTLRDLRFPAAAVAVVALCGLLAGSVTASPVPTGFRPGDFTATSELDWWVLGTTYCGRAQCLIPIGRS